MHYNSMSVLFVDKRKHYFQKKNSNIINKIPNFSFQEQKLLLEPKRSAALPYFSPDVTLGQKRIFKKHEILNPLGHSDPKIGGSKSGKLPNSGYFNSFTRIGKSPIPEMKSKEMVSHSWKRELFLKLLQFSINQNKIYVI